MNENKTTTYLTPEQMDHVLATLANPPPPNPALIALFRDYMERVADGRIITDATTPAEAREWLDARGYP